MPGTKRIMACSRSISGPTLRWPELREPRLDLAVEHCREQSLRFRVIIVNPGAARPPITGEQECHREIFFAVWRWCLVVRRAVRLARPGKVPVRRMLRVADVHIGSRPVPEPVELRLLIQLDRDHHPVRHALGANVVVGPIGQIHKGPVRISARGKHDGLRLRIAVEQLPVSSVDFSLHFCGRVTCFCEETAVLSGRKCTGTIIVRDLTGPGLRVYAKQNQCGEYKRHRRHKTVVPVHDTVIVERDISLLLVS